MSTINYLGSEGNLLNPTENNIVGKSVILIIAIALSLAVPMGVSMFSEENVDTKPVTDNSDITSQVSEKSKNTDASENEEITEEISQNSGFYMADIFNLENVDYFASGTLEHIFDGTINKKGNATGYHYTMVLDSKGKIIDGTRSKEDENGVFTGNVEVDGVKKNGFSSFYPESWTPQQVVDAINAAYDEATANPDNPTSNSLWIGHYGDIEIDMYLDSNQKITTAYPVYKK